MFGWKRLWMVWGLSFGWCSGYFAQSSSEVHLKGFVYDADREEGIPFARIEVSPGDVRTLTDENGFFLIRLPVGTYRIRVYAFQYDTVEREVHLKPEQRIVQLRIELQSRLRKLEKVVVRAQRYVERQKLPEVSAFRITRKQILRMPSLGKPDLLQYVVTLPGVVSTGDAGSRFFVRGGTPAQVLTLLDGIPVYELQHTAGIFSVLSPEVLQRVSFYAGGFPAEYGGRLSGIIDMRTRSISPQFHGVINLNPLSLDALWNIPVGRRSGFLVASQVARMDLSQKLLYTYVDSPGLPYRFLDLFVKGEVRSRDGNRVSGIFFSFRDSLVSDALRYRWENRGGGVHFVVTPGMTRFFLQGLLGFSRYSTFYQPRGFYGSEAILSTFHGEVHVQYPNPLRMLRYGVQLSGASTILRFYTLYGTLITYARHTSEVALYIKYRRTWEDLFSLEGGMRLHFYASAPAMIPEPRLQIKYFITPRFRIKGASGIYTQSLFTTTANYEATYLFVGYLNLPEESVPFRGRLLQQRIQSALDGILGVEWNPVPELFLSVEGYLKRFFRIFSVNRYKVFPEDPNYLAEVGNAYGMDAFAEWQSERLSLRLTYSLLFAERTDDRITYIPWFARRHTFHFTGWTALDPDQKWQMSLRWTFGSGLFFTPVAGFYPALPTSSTIFTDPTTASYVPLVVEDRTQYYRKELPPYHRLDWTLERHFYLPHSSRIVAFITLFNVYNRLNVLFVQRLTGEVVYQLPFLPIMGIRYYHRE